MFQHSRFYVAHHQCKENCNVFPSAKFCSSLWDSVIEQCDLCVCTRHMKGYIKLSFNHVDGGLAEKIVSNGGLLCNSVHSLTTYNDNSFAFGDTTVKKCSDVVSNEKGTQDGSKAQFFQPTVVICFDYGTMFTVDTSTEAPSA